MAQQNNRFSFYGGDDDNETENFSDRHTTSNKALSVTRDLS
jgi:hypothetical protein